MRITGSGRDLRPGHSFAYDLRIDGPETVRFALLESERSAYLRRVARMAIEYVVVILQRMGSEPVTGNAGGGFRIFGTVAPTLADNDLLVFHDRRTIWVSNVLQLDSIPTMSAVAVDSSASPPRPSRAGRTAAGHVEFWVVFSKFRSRHPPSSVIEWRRVFHHLVDQVNASPSVVLFDAVEAGVPTHLVHVIAGATGEAASDVMELIGVSQTTFRRKEEAKEPLPDVAGHRVMGFLRVAAKLRKLLEESGDPEQLKEFDVEGWVTHWMREKLPELGGKTPAELLRNPEGQRAVEEVLERMRGGLPA